MFEFQGAKISAKSLTIADEEDIIALLLLLPEGKQTNAAYRFAEFMYGSVVEGKFPVPHVSKDDSADVVTAAHQAWRQLPRGFPALWVKELEAAEGSPKE